MLGVHTPPFGSVASSLIRVQLQLKEVEVCMP